MAAGRGDARIREGCAAGGVRQQPGRDEQDEVPRGVREGSKRDRQYEHIKDSYQERGVSKGEAEERAARTVNKARREAGQTRDRGKRA